MYIKWDIKESLFFSWKTIVVFYRFIEFRDFSFPMRSKLGFACSVSAISLF